VYAPEKLSLIAEDCHTAQMATAVPLFGNLLLHLRSQCELRTQIEERNYHDRFLASGKPIILLGLSFKREPSLFGITYASKVV
jgi:hypothetical protein